MKRFYFILNILLASSLLSAQPLDRSKKPEPGVAREIKIGSYESFTLDNGLKVFVVENRKLPRVSISMVLDYDPVMEGKKAGYVDMAGQMLKRGTSNRTKAALDKEVDFMGASLSMSATGGFASGLSKHFDKIAELMSDVVMNPSFPEEEFKKIMKQSKSGLESAKDQPSFMMSNLEATKLYGKLHPYGEVETEATLDEIGLEDCKNFHSNYFKPNIAYMAIVGDVNVKDAQRIIKKHFEKWAAGEVPTAEYPAPAPAAAKVTTVSLVNRDASVQSNIQIANTYELKPGDADAIGLSLATSILGGGSLGRLFLNLREDKAYTYGAYASAGTDPLVANFSATAEVRNAVTDSAIAEILSEIRKMREELVPAQELQNAKNYISGNFGLSLENPQTIARFAINTARYNLPKNYYQNYLKTLNALTAADLQTIANKYYAVDNTNIMVVGKAADIASSLETFGALQYYDIYGKKTDAPNLPIPDGLNAAKVFANYFTAIGGQKAASKVKTLDQTFTGEIPGQEMTLDLRLRKINGKAMSQEISVAGMGTVQKMQFDGTKARMSSMQGKQDLDGEDVANLGIETFVFKPLAFGPKAGFTTEIERVSMVNGKPANVVGVSKDGKKVVSLYFEQESGLLVREDAVAKGPQGDVVSTTNFGDFRVVNGLKIPHALSMDLGGGNKLQLVSEGASLNNKLNPKDFEVK